MSATLSAVHGLVFHEYAMLSRGQGERIFCVNVICRYRSNNMQEKTNISLRQIGDGHIEDSIQEDCGFKTYWRY